MNQKKAKSIRQEVIKGMIKEKITNPRRLYRIAKRMYNETPRILRNNFTILQ